MEANLNLLKAKMAEYGTSFFVKDLCRILNISKPTAVKKLKGQAKFKKREVSELIKYFNLSTEEVEKIFGELPNDKKDNTKHEG